MSEFDGELYKKFSSSVRHQVKSLHIILDALQVKHSLEQLHSLRQCGVCTYVCMYVSKIVAEFLN